MASKLQIPELLQAWLSYIHIENLCNAKVDAREDSSPRIWDKGVTLLGDKLLLEETLFKEFKQQLKDSKTNSKAKELLIAVAFPQLYVIEEGGRQFRPLFTIDISPIFAGNYRKSGWDLTAFEFQPIIPNLMEWYGLDEEAAESLVTLEGLKVFLETTFNRPFKTLQDFIGLIELPPSPVRSKLLPYLLNFGYVPFNHNLKKDLQKINSAPRWDWAVPEHPAYEYLHGQPQMPQHEVLFLGAFPISPPDDYQTSALKHSQSNPLTAVIGPPGNGKTTLLLHQIAQQVVKRAVQLATYGEDESNLTLVTSTNNRAVNNVEELLTINFPSEQFYLSGGSKELVDTQVLPKLQTALEMLAAETFDSVVWESTKQQLLAGVQQLQSHLKQDAYYQQQRGVDEQLLEQINGDIEVLEQAIKTSTSDFQHQSEQKPTRDYSEFPLEAYQQIQQHLDNAWHSLPPVDYSQLSGKGGNWLIRLWHRIQIFWQEITKSSPRYVLKRLHKQVEMPVLATLATPFPFQIPLTTESLAAARQSVSQLLSVAFDWQQQNRPSKRQQQSESLQRQLTDLITRRSQVQNRLTSYPTKDFYSRFYTDYHSLQVQLFELSWQFQQLEALRRKDEVIASIKTYIAILNNEWEAYRQLALNWQSIYRDISLLFPVFLSTLHSIRRLFPYPDTGCIARVIVDEAGQIPVHQVFPALVRCHQALIVGDPWQLEPVVQLSNQKKEEYRQTAFLESGLTEENYDLYSPSACTAYHRAAGASGQSGEIGNGIILKQHYRCVPSIITFSDRLCNYGMEIDTQEKPSRLGTNLLAIHVEGDYSNHVNTLEIEKVAALIQELLAAGYSLNSPDSLNTIGVISPYRSQANALQLTLQSRWNNFPSDSIGTVHTFQGGQKAAIILSTRQCHSTDSLWFINRQPNLLNVAVSRARELFILVGNLERLKKEGYTKQLVEYIEQFGEVR
ncbi:DNA helicase [[Phormidium ambiguum] IAM M-71]|uniref:DNA helicase n=1 Tax=[Phormidium ambiguum] IAM M-71 TaxID=454136 RepID=A0A1U7I7P2_9CYAN|nr:DEAD/DEAH box helicase [Phormidium ambiguum]OKH32388.1 DNA helicase [Phormidium ambiguum IAM M-71]